MLLRNTTQQALHKNLLTTEPIMGLLLGVHHWVWLIFPGVSLEQDSSHPGGCLQLYF